MEQAKQTQETYAQQEKKFLVENADELAAKYNREKLKQRRVEYEARQRAAKEQTEAAAEAKLKESVEESAPEQAFFPSQSAAAPYGKWQIVEQK